MKQIQFKALLLQTFLDTHVFYSTYLYQILVSSFAFYLPARCAVVHLS